MQNSSPVTDETPLVPVTVPPMPEGATYSSNHWRQMVTGVHISRAGNRSITGTELAPGDEVRLPVGALVMVVDKQVTGWRDGYRSYKRVPLMEADVELHLVTEVGLEELWEYHYMTERSIFGAKTCNKINALLAKHPAPRGEVTVVRAARRPNRRPGVCRWCDAPVDAGKGHLVGWGREAVVEHYEECPPRTVTGGEVCVVCSVTVQPVQARRYLRREGKGVWETRHLPYVNCREQPPVSYEEQQEEIARAAAQRREQRRQQAIEEEKRVRRNEQARERNRRKREAKRQEARRLHEEHLVRIAGLKTVSRTSSTVADKGLEPGGAYRARMRRHADVLEGGAETVRWSVELYFRELGAASAEAFEVEEFDWEEEARDRYREHEYRPEPYQLSPRVEPESGGCPGMDVAHCYHCGSPIDGHAMLASTGPACDVECFDAMADAVGRHARRWHT